MLAYLNDPQLKSDIVDEIRKHREADQIVKGTYGRMNGKWKGCAIGCSIRSLNLRRGLNLPTDAHSVYETHLGIPQHIARLEDSIFEALPEDRYAVWPEQVADAIRPGADLSMVWPQMGLWILADSGFLKITDDNRASIEGVIALYRCWVAGEKPPNEEWKKARAAAAAAAYAYADAYAYAYAAAYAAADAAAYAAAAADAAAYAAAYAYAYAYAYAAAAAAWKKSRTQAWCKIADKLLELLRAA